MTFAEQILGVPLALVEQGWRREPTPEVMDAWSGTQRQHYRWEAQGIKVDGQWVNICRPIFPLEGGTSLWGPACPVYAHEGWGDGLAPTPETVKVWEYWWLRDTCGNLKVCRVHVHSDRDMETADYWIGDRLVFHSEIFEWGTWAGPVLPPVRQS